MPAHWNRFCILRFLATHAVVQQRSREAKYTSEHVVSRSHLVLPSMAASVCCLQMTTDNASTLELILHPQVSCNTRCRSAAEPRGQIHVRTCSESVTSCAALHGRACMLSPDDN